MSEDIASIKVGDRVWRKLSQGRKIVTVTKVTDKFLWIGGENYWRESKETYFSKLWPHRRINGHYAGSAGRDGYGSIEGIATAEELERWDRQKAVEQAARRIEEEISEARENLLVELTALFGNQFDGKKAHVRPAEFSDQPGMFRVVFEPLTEKEIRQFAEDISH